MAKKLSFFDGALMLAFFASIACIGASLIFTPPKSFSAEENRPLAARPAFSWKALVSGEYFEGISTYCSDQMPLKRSFSNLYATCELALGKREVNGVLLLEGGRLVTRAETHSAGILQRNKDAVSKLAQIRDRVFTFVAPSTQTAFQNSLPKQLSSSSEFDFEELGNAAAEFLNIAESTPDALYYATDHHWTSDGAYAAYQALCRELGIEPYGEEHFERQRVSKSFYGSAYRRSALPKCLVSADEIVLYRCEEDEEFEIFVHDMQTVRWLYALDELDGSDQYRVFLGGNYAHSTLTSKGAKGREKLLLIKDSFANSIVPFLALHYDIEIVDPRYADAALAEKLATDESISTILILCSSDTLASERAYGAFITRLASP